VIFQLAEIHNAVEVSEATWTANGNTPLPGFSTPFGGGQVTGLSAGVHYYVCSPHASGGMKGMITVTSPSGINDYASSSGKFDLYPNPTKGKVTWQYSGSTGMIGNGLENDLKSSLEIFNLVGDKVFEKQGFKSSGSNEIDLTDVPDGIYFVRISDRKQIYTMKLVKQ
jgi:hypothetical protein